MTEPWPELAVADWEDTREGLLRRLQIVGKLTLTGAAAQNHWWHVPLRLTPRGLRTPLLRNANGRPFEVVFDCVDHFLAITTPTDHRRVEVVSEPLADFYSKLSSALSELDVALPILARPVEVPDPATPFAEETGYAGYDPHAVRSFWELLTHIDAVFETFASSFTGKASRPGLWWGGLDYAAARWSGRPAPKHPGGAPNVANWVMEEGYSHEVAAYGYFAAGAPEGCFYAYTYPTPPSYKDQPVAGAEWNDELGEWLLSYQTVRRSADPAKTLLDFLTSAYDAAANTADWPQ